MSVSHVLILSWSSLLQYARGPRRKTKERNLQKQQSHFFPSHNSMVYYLLQSHRCWFSGKYVGEVRFPPEMSCLCFVSLSVLWQEISLVASEYAELAKMSHWIRKENQVCINACGILFLSFSPLLSVFPFSLSSLFSPSFPPSLAHTHHYQCLETSKLAPTGWAMHTLFQKRTSCWV